MSFTNSHLHTELASHELGALSLVQGEVLSALNNMDLATAAVKLDQARSAVSSFKERSAGSTEELLNDIFVLEELIALTSSLLYLWDNLKLQRFAKSWVNVQDGLDSIRLIKRFSDIQLGAYEKYLLALEQFYPYVNERYASIGARVKWFECSICGADIDSFACVHRRGSLYGGVLACGIAHDIETIDHIALVENPADKRCVTSYADSDVRFQLIRYLSELVTSGRLPPLTLCGLSRSIRRVRNPNFKKLGRNERCFCGSSKKFKNCCASREFFDREHVDVLPLDTELI